MNSKTPILILALAFLGGCNFAGIQGQAGRTEARCTAPVDRDGIHWNQTNCWAQSR